MTDQPEPQVNQQQESEQLKQDLLKMRVAELIAEAIDGFIEEYLEGDLWDDIDEEDHDMFADLLETAPEGLKDEVVSLALQQLLETE